MITKNPKVCMSILLLWGLLFFLIIYSLSESSISISFGPEEGRKFLSITIDTWYKWALIATLIMIDKFIITLSVDILGPWMSNYITSHHNKKLPYPKWICLLLSDLYSLYFNLRYIVTLQLLITQTDYSILRIFVDLLATHISTKMHLKDKEYKKEV